MTVANPRSEPAADAELGGPRPSIKRLPRYLRLVRELRERGVEYVSTTQIAGALELVPVQVRKDLAITGVVGRPKVGYLASELITSIERFLGWDALRPAVLVGAGHLGRALLGYDFSSYGLELVAAFDANLAKVGTTVQGRKVLPVRQLEAFVSKRGIELAVLTVPAAAADAAARELVAAGIRGIWNFSSPHLVVPAGVTVVTVELVSSLAVLSHMLLKSAGAEAKAARSPSTGSRRSASGADAPSRATPKRSLPGAPRARTGQ